MSRGVRQSQIEMVGQCEERTEVVISESEGSKPEYIIDVSQSDDLSTVTMRWTATPQATIVSTRMRWKSCPKHPNHGTDEALRCKGCSSIAKGAGPVQIYQILPHDCEVRDVRGVDEQPSIPACHVTLPHDNGLARVHLSGPGNCTDN